MSLLEHARQYVAHGYSVIPLKMDGSKAPSLPAWKAYQAAPPDDLTLLEWFGDARPAGLGVVCGAVSGNLEVIDLDDAVIRDAMQALVEEAVPGLWERLVIVETPRPGYHLWYRSEHPVAGNQILARRRIGERPNGEDDVRALIETRGEGGQVAAYGSHRSVHASGRPYRPLAGDLFNPPVLTLEERETLLDSARALNEYVPADRFHSQPAAPREFRSDDVLPGEHYNETGDPLPLLLTAGWTIVRTCASYLLLRAPGKDRGWSASFGQVGRNVLVVFSTNAHPFEAERGYDPFAIYTLIEHRGDWNAAAKALYSQGFGTRAKADVMPLPPESAAPPEASRWEANAALYEEERAARFAEKADRVERASAHPAISEEPYRSPFFTLEELANIPPVEWRVEGFLPKNGFGAWWGEGGAYKTFVALDLALAMVHGLDWHGMTTAPGPVAYLAGEGAHGLGVRIQAWREEHKVELKHQFHVLPYATDFRDRAAVTELLGHIERLPEKPALVIVDTLARHLPAGNENSPEDMGAFILGCDRIRTATGAFVLTLHHGNKTGDHYRGHSSLLGAVDVMVEVTKSFSVVNLSCVKMKDGPAFDPPLQFPMMPVGESLVLGDMTGPTSTASGNDSDRQILAALGDATCWLKTGDIIAATGLQKRIVQRKLPQLENAGLIAAKGKAHSPNRSYLITDEGRAMVPATPKNP